MQSDDVLWGSVPAQVRAVFFSFGVAFSDVIFLEFRDWEEGGHREMCLRAAKIRRQRALDRISAQTVRAGGS